MQLALDIRGKIERAESGTVNTVLGVRPYKMQLLKWIGNKQRFAHEIVSFFPKRFRVYHEPFLGAGGVLAVLAPRKAEAADSFKPLVGIWQTLKRDPKTVKQWYRERWEESQSGEKVVQYEKIKARCNAGPNPADLLFLSRSAYGGVMRFRMRDGYMSTPCGVHKPIHFGTFGRRVDEWPQRVSGTEFFHREYEESLERAREGDVVYCDPPYSHSQAILYGAQSFSQDDLFRSIERAKKRGVFVALSLDGSKKSGAKDCDYQIPASLFEQEVRVNCGRSMLRRFQMGGRTLEGEVVFDRLLRIGKNDLMSEFETATIAFQNASLWATYAQAGVAGLVGLVQCLLIAYGLKLMQRSNTDRQRQTDLAEKRHEESMLALRTLIERTAQR